MTDHMPLVSIVSPSFNQGRFIEQMIASVRNQTYSNIEHIVVDGGSADDTVEILKRYEGHYNLRWFSESDSGMYDAINRGLRVAHGDILAYLNTDDLYFPWTVQAAVRCFHAHPEAMLLYGDMISRDLETGADKILLFPPSFNLHRFVRGGWLGQPAVFFRSALVERIGLFNEELKLLGDWDYWVRAGMAARLVKCQEVLAIQTNHGTTKRHLQRAELAFEGARLKEKYRALTGADRWALLILLDQAMSRISFLGSMGGLVRSYVFGRKGPHRGERDRPWGAFTTSPGFRIVSWTSLLASLLPRLGRRHQSKWLRLSYPSVAANP